MNTNIYSFTQSTYHPNGDDTSEIEPCKTLDCNLGHWRFVPMYCMLSGEQQICMQKEFDGQWYDRECFPYTIDNLTAELAYQLVKDR